MEFIAVDPGLTVGITSANRASQAQITPISPVNLIGLADYN
ncbi:MAG: hypothetical protein U0401_09495 [Anaerolineae bacterium]